MGIDIENRSGVHVVRVTGERLGEADEALLDAVTELLEARGSRIVVDLSGVKTINSRGLSDLVSLTAQANQRGCRVAMAAPSAFVAGVFETTQLDRFLQVHPTLEAAIAGLA